MTADEILQSVSEKATPAERAAYLDRACGHDAVLRSQVEGLLAALDGAGSFLEQPVFDTPETVDAALLANEALGLEAEREDDGNLALCRAIRCLHGRVIGHNMTIVINGRALVRSRGAGTM